MARYFIILASLLYAQINNAQVSDEQSSSKMDNEFIQKVDSKLIIGGLISTFQDTRELMAADGVGYKLKSNLPGAIGLFFKYKNWPSVKLTVPIPTETEGNEVSTKGLRLGVHISPAQNVVVDLYYSNLSEFNQLTLDEKQVAPLGDVSSKNIALNAYYIFNGSKFSYKHSFSVGQRQLKSAGSWMLGLSFNLTRQEKTTSVFQNQDRLLQLMDFTEISGTQISILGGYAHNWILGAKKKGFLSLGFFLGPNFNSGNINYSALPEDDFSSLNYSATSIVSGGVNFDNGLLLQFKVFTNDYGYRIPDVDLRSDLLEGELSLVKYVN